MLVGQSSSVLNSISHTAVCEEHSPKLECVESAALQASVPPNCAIYTHPNQHTYMLCDLQTHAHTGMHTHIHTHTQLGRLESAL